MLLIVIVTKGKLILEEIIAKLVVTNVKHVKILKLSVLFVQMPIENC